MTGIEPAYSAWEVFSPVERASNNAYWTNRLSGKTVLPPELKFHALRYTHAILCVAAGIKPDKLSGRTGHANVRTTLDVYVHLFPDYDATEDMAALGAMGQANRRATW